MREIQRAGNQAQYELSDLGLLSGANVGPYPTVLALLNETVQPDCSFLAVADGTTDELFFKAFLGLDPAFSDAGRVTRSDLFACGVGDLEVPLAVSTAARQPGFRRTPIIDALGIGAFAAAPVTGPDDQTVGALWVVCHHARIWSRSDRSALVRCAALCSELVMFAACKATVRILSRERA
ncbi:MAG: GAF domain-containing protein [Pseudomonadota bacterium]